MEAMKYGNTLEKCFRSVEKGNVLMYNEIYIYFLTVFLKKKKCIKQVKCRSNGSPLQVWWMKIKSMAKLLHEGLFWRTLSF